MNGRLYRLAAFCMLGYPWMLVGCGPITEDEDAVLCAEQDGCEEADDETPNHDEKDGDEKDGDNLLDVNKDSATTGEPLLVRFQTGHVPALVLGQADFTSVQVNRGGDVGPDTLAGPDGLAVNSGRLAIADRGNNRVLLYPTIPAENGAVPEIVLGQPDFAVNSGGLGNAPGSMLQSPRGVALDGDHIFVGDSMNHRVLVWNAWPGALGIPADVVLGQPDFETGTSGRSSTALNSFYALGTYAWDGQLFVADRGNGRALRFIPSGAGYTTGQEADMVLGADDFGTYGSFGDTNDVWTDGEIMCVSTANRVHIFNTAPTVATGAVADVVVGEIAGLNYPHACIFTGSQLIVADTDNHRILIWDGVPTEDRVPDHVLGQADFDTKTANRTEGATGATWQFSAELMSTVRNSAGPLTLAAPTMLRFEGQRLFVADQTNNRVLIFEGEVVESAP